MDEEGANPSLIYIAPSFAKQVFDQAGYQSPSWWLVILSEGIIEFFGHNIFGDHEPDHHGEGIIQLSNFEKAEELGWTCFLTPCVYFLDHVAIEDIFCGQSMILGGPVRTFNRSCNTNSESVDGASR